MEEIESKISRRLLFTAGIITLLLLLSTRFYLIPLFTHQSTPDFYSVLYGIIDNLSIALVSGIMLTFIIFYILPISKHNTRIRIVEPVELKAHLRKSLAKTTEFWYIGHTGKWTRSVTIPQLAEDALKENRTKRINIVLLDPLSEEACRNMANFHQKILGSRNSIDDLYRHNIIDIAASIVSLYAWKAQVPKLEISLALTDKISLFRIDLTSSMATITQADSRIPTTCFDHNSIYYNLYREEARIKYDQARKLCDEPKHACTFEDLNKLSVKNLLEELGFGDLNFTDREFSEITRISKKPKKPY